MRFVKIKWKNLLSYGNKIQEYTFGIEPKLVHIQGKNGSGKSSIKEALTISAYGKSAIRKMKDIPNWVNRQTYTYNEFETSSGDIVVIERGIDPNFSSITKNGVPYNLPDKRKIDEFIEHELLDLNFPIFCNTISLSFDDFKSFVSLSPSDKRKIVDPMFGIDILTDMRLNVKTDIKDNKKELDIIESNISRNNALLQSSINQLDELKKKLKNAVVDKSNKINEMLDIKKISLTEHQNKYNEIKSKINSIRDKALEFGQKTANINAKILEFNNKLKLFENKQCPHCLSDLTGDSAFKIKEAILEKKKVEQELFNKILESQKQIKTSIDDLTRDQDIEKEAYYTISAEIKNLQLELQACQNDKSDNQVESIKNIINNINDSIKTSDTESKQYVENLELLEMLDEILSDYGIKKILIDRVIPLLNNRIAEISDRFEFKFKFSFDNEFNPIIRYLNMDISPDSLSTGQKKKMNLIVLLSFIELIKLKHTNMNVMFLDEIFSGLDKDNVYMAIELLREYANKYKMTIFVVSHESLPDEFFDETIDVTMPNHFSEIKIISKIKEPIL